MAEKIVDPLADLEVVTPETEQVVLSDEPPAKTEREIELEKRIEELENAALTGAAPDVPPSRPKPDNELTPEQLRIRELEHKLALQSGSSEPAEQFDDVADGEKILIHVLEDGFTALDRVWYRGQEIEFVKGGQAYKDTFDRAGESWLNLTTAEQYRRWGTARFAVGPWPGVAYDDESAEAQERARNRRAPVLPNV